MRRPFKGELRVDTEDVLSQVKPFQEAEVKRRRHEQDMARTRRGFWEIHDIDRWAAGHVRAKPCRKASIAVSIR
jgi:hypothetical protein